MAPALTERCGHDPSAPSAWVAVTNTDNLQLILYAFLFPSAGGTGCPCSRCLHGRVLVTAILPGVHVISVLGERRESKEEKGDGMHQASQASFCLFGGIGSPEVSQAGLKSAPWTDHGLRLATIFLLLPSAPELQAYVTIPSLWGL